MCLTGSLDEQCGLTMLDFHTFLPFLFLISYRLICKGLRICSKFDFQEKRKCIFIFYMSALFCLFFIVFYPGLIFSTIYCLCGLIIGNMDDNQDRIRLGRVSRRFSWKKHDPQNHQLILVRLMQKCQLLRFMHLRLRLLGGGRCHLLIPRKPNRSRLRHQM